MENNRDKKAIDLLSDQIINAVKTICSKLEFDKTYIGIVSSVNKDGYTVKYNGTEINIKTKETGIFKKSDTVKICIPCGNKRKAFIVADLDFFVKYYDKKTDEINVRLYSIEQENAVKSIDVSEENSENLI